jgi:hypothetical protein
MSIKCLALAFVFAASHTQACESSQNRPTQIKSVAFERNSDAISSQQISDLASWAVDMKQGYPIHLWMTIVATAGPDEHQAAALAAHRASKVKHLTDQFGLTRSHIEVRSYVDSTEAAELNGSFATSAQIDLSPGCPHDCCDE